jgi:hypothetical protein
MRYLIILAVVELLLQSFQGLVITSNDGTAGKLQKRRANEHTTTICEKEEQAIVVPTW